jgi:4-hydroxybenzoate polyprenyltransferase
MASGTTRPLVARPLLAFAKIVKVPFWFTWVTPAVFGYYASAGQSPQQLGWFILLCVVLCIAEAMCNLHNELVDREEDAINQPNRARLLDQVLAVVDERRLWQVVILGYGLTSLVMVALWVYVDPVVALCLLYLGVHAILYNFGLRLKRRPGYAELTIGVAALTTFLLGWAWHESALDMPVEGWVLAYFMGITVFSKDLPDTVGDEVVNASSLFSIRTPERLRAALAFVYLSPYALVVALVLAGLLPPRLLAMCLLLPVGAWFAFAADSIRSLTAKVAAYHVAFVYGHVFLLTLFVLSVNTVGAAVAAAGLFLARLAALALRLDPRLVEPDFPSWPDSLRALVSEQRLRVRSPQLLP